MFARLRWFIIAPAFLSAAPSATLDRARAPRSRPPMIAKGHAARPRLGSAIVFSSFFRRVYAVFVSSVAFAADRIGPKKRLHARNDGLGRCSAA